MDGGKGLTKQEQWFYKEQERALRQSLEVFLNRQSWRHLLPENYEVWDNFFVRDQADKGIRDLFGLSKDDRWKERKRLMRRLLYSVYRRTGHWQRLRDKALKRYGKVCTVCKAPTNKPEVHHKHYRTLGRETLHDVHVLCSNCHLTLHVLDLQGFIIKEELLQEEDKQPAIPKPPPPKSKSKRRIIRPETSTSDPKKPKKATRSPRRTFIP